MTNNENGEFWEDNTAKAHTEERDGREAADGRATLKELAKRFTLHSVSNWVTAHRMTSISSKQCLVVFCVALTECLRLRK